eukprot:c19989_g1_i1.p1 GENE.c19989_g1_i1~~c19989_g1_i1.p1  ORF type:complete len:588 (+),score=109.60 c19989_g1_i1:1188-2951(+)
MPKLIYLVLSSNRLTGRIPNATSFSPAMTHLVLHNNALTGQIPTEIALLTNLKLVSLFDNRLRGSLPALWQNEDTIFLLFNNFLSCVLPPRRAGGDGDTTEEIKTLIAIGNEFSQDGVGAVEADWLSTWDRSSIHLFIPLPRPWFTLMLVVVFGVVACLVCLGFGWLVCWRRRPIALNPRLPICGSAAVWERSLILGGTMTGVAVLVVPVLVVVPTIHQCGEFLSEATLAEQSSPVCYFTAVHSILHFFWSCWAVLWLAKTGFVFPYNTVNRDPKNTAKPPSRFVRMSIGMLWACAILVFNIPTLLFMALSALPTDNVVGLDAWSRRGLTSVAAPILVLISTFLIPFLSQQAVRLYSPHLNESQIRKNQFALSMISEALVLVILPIISEMALGDGCWQGWKMLWTPCGFREETFDSLADSNILDHVFVLSQEEVCTPKLRDPGRCSRHVIRIVSQLILAKVVVQAFTMSVWRLFVFGFGLHVRVKWTWAQHFKFVDTERLTHVILSWMMMGFAYGAVAPLFWVAVMLALLCQCLTVIFLVAMESVHGQVILTHKEQTPPVPRAIVATGIAVQLCLGVWHFSTAQPCG